MTSYHIGRTFPHQEIRADGHYRALAIAMESVVLDLPGATEAFRTVATEESQRMAVARQAGPIWWLQEAGPDLTPSSGDKPIDIAGALQRIEQAAMDIAKTEGDQLATRFLTADRATLATSIADRVLPMIEQLANEYRLPDAAMDESAYFVARGLLIHHVPGFSERHDARMAEELRKWLGDFGTSTRSDSGFLQPNLFIEHSGHIAYLKSTPELILQPEKLLIEAAKATETALAEIKLSPKPEADPENTWPPKTKGFWKLFG